MSPVSATFGSFKFRSAILLVVVLLWTMTAITFHAYYAALARDKYLAAGNRIAIRHGTYDGGRGRILDRNGSPLAWSERRFDIFLFKIPEDKEVLNGMMERIKQVLPEAGCLRMKQGFYLIQSDIPPEKILDLEPLLNLFPDLKILPRVDRCVMDYQEVRSLIGKTQIKEGILVGVSGLEREYNGELTGTQGQYEVMLDRHKNWVRNTWQLIKKAAPGKDVKLNVILSDLIIPAAKTPPAPPPQQENVKFDTEITLDNWEIVELPANINDLTAIDAAGAK
jgi:cell division protein FtsI/penicillin-binding protein 2